MHVLEMNLGKWAACQGRKKKMKGGDRKENEEEENGETGQTRSR